MRLKGLEASIKCLIIDSLHGMMTMDALGVLELAQDEAEEDRNRAVHQLRAFAFIFILFQSSWRSLAEDFGHSGRG